MVKRMKREYVLPSINILSKDSEIIDLESNCVGLRRLMEIKNYPDKLVVPLGLEKGKKCRYLDFKDMDLLMVVGETGSGKSIFLDSVIISLIMKNTPDDLKLVLMDPKRVELSYYNELPHMFLDVCSSLEESTIALDKIKEEINNRKKSFDREGFEDIFEYNDKVSSKLSHIFVVIDESCELLKDGNNLDKLRDMVFGCDKYGIHFIIATNSYNMEYFSEEFMEKINYKISFDLVSKADASLVRIRDSKNLQVGEGIAVSRIDRKRFRIQTPYITDVDIKRVIDFLMVNN